MWPKFFWVLPQLACVFFRCLVPDCAWTRIWAHLVLWVGGLFALCRIVRECESECAWLNGFGDCLPLCQIVLERQCYCSCFSGLGGLFCPVPDCAWMRICVHLVEWVEGLFAALQDWPWRPILAQLLFGAWGIVSPCAGLRVNANPRALGWMGLGIVCLAVRLITSQLPSYWWASLSFLVRICPNL
jgi:hypothetical protein